MTKIGIIMPPIGSPEWCALAVHIATKGLPPAPPTPEPTPIPTTPTKGSETP